MEINETNAVPPSVESQVAAIRAKRKRKFNPWWVIVPVFLIVGIAIGYFGRPLFHAIPATSDKPDAVDFLIAQTRYFRGNGNAPVTMLEFSDFQ